MALLRSLLTTFSQYTRSIVRSPSRAMSSGEWGSGSGKGGGSGGSIRDAGGAFGKQESAREEEWARRQQREQLEMLQANLISEIDRNEEMIKQHEATIEKAKKQMKELTDLRKQSQ